MDRTRRQLIVSTGALSLATLAGCIGDEADDAEDDDHSDDGGHGDLHVEDGFVDDIGMVDFQLLDRSHDPHEAISYMHEDHWHASGDFPMIPTNETLSIGAVGYDEDGEELELWNDYSLKAAVAPGAQEDIVSFDYHGDHVYIHGEKEGLTEIVFMVWHDDHADYQTKPLAVQVGEEEKSDTFDAHHVSNVHVSDRTPDPHEEVADWHEDHWDGELPTVHVDDTISLGATFVDEDGYEADLNGTYELRVRLEEDAPDIVAFDYHGDHIYIIGEETGETAVVFQLWHDDHADFETTPIEITVN